MRNDVPAIRILPMSDKIPGFRGRSIQSVQQELFLRDLPKNGGRFRYCSTGLNAPPGTLVLFQFQARVIATGAYLRDERFEKPIRGYAGELLFEPRSFRTFEPLDADAIRKVWPSFKRFGHAKFALNPTLYSKFLRQLKPVQPAPPR